jgi:hypothetical protein
MNRTQVHIRLFADTDQAGRDLALVVFSDRTYEYIPHEEF